uniref:Uncharacterized protein n=1 Tax=Ixodes ricinus TaxID=34613 RepID=A0A0K8RBN5_IXORI
MRVYLPEPYAHLWNALQLTRKLSLPHTICTTTFLATGCYSLLVEYFSHCPAGFAICWHCTPFEYCVMPFKTALMEVVDNLELTNMLILEVFSPSFFALASSQSGIYTTLVFKLSLSFVFS